MGTTVSSAECQGCKGGMCGDGKTKEEACLDLVKKIEERGYTITNLDKVKEILSEYPKECVVLDIYTVDRFLVNFGSSFTLNDIGTLEQTSYVAYLRQVPCNIAWR